MSINYRAVMEWHLGRTLERHEVVHHINGDRRDNRLENLQVLSSQREHARLHGLQKNAPPSVVYPLRLKDSLLRKLKKQAKLEKRTVAYIIRKAIEEGIERRAEETPR